jgi:hypothetical protein
MGRSLRSIRAKNRAIDKLFHGKAADLKAVVSDSELLKKHLYFLRYAPVKKTTRYGEDVSVVRNLRLYYPTLAARWEYLLNVCYNKENPIYHLFGGRGIFMSKGFRDSRIFCKWCLKNKVIDAIGSYTLYIQRKNKNKGYYWRNCYTVTEKELHECHNIKTALDLLVFAKKYREGHHKSVSYMTAYTRYFAYDFPLDGALNTEYFTACTIVRNPFNVGFSPSIFYRSVADEKSCTQSVFLSRMHYAYMNGGFTCRPYDMLKPDFSVSATANMENKLSYKQMWNRTKKENKNKNKEVYTDKESSVYSNSPEIKIYDDS